MKLTPKKILVIALIIFIIGLLLACSNKDDPTLSPNTVGCFTVDNQQGRVNVGEVTYSYYLSEIAAHPNTGNDPQFKPGHCKW